MGRGIKLKTVVNLYDSIFYMARETRGYESPAINAQLGSKRDGDPPRHKLWEREYR